MSANLSRRRLIRSGLATAAGATAMVDITAANMNLVDGHVTIGFGSHDVLVRRVWVLSPTHAVANVSVAANAPQSFSELSVISGMQFATFGNAIQTQSARSGVPLIAYVGNGDPNQQSVVAAYE